MKAMQQRRESPVQEDAWLADDPHPSSSGNQRREPDLVPYRIAISGTGVPRPKPAVPGKPNPFKRRRPPAQDFAMDDS